jgi:tubulin beta
VVCDENGIGDGGSGEHFGNSELKPGHINALYHEASGGENVPRAVLFDLEPGVIGAVSLSRRSANSSAQNADAGSNWTKAHYIKAGCEFS